MRCNSHVRFTPNSNRKSEIPAKGHVCYAPESGHVRCACRCPLSAISGHRALFDHLVGAADQGVGDRDAERLGCSEIYDELYFSCLLYRQIGRLVAF